MERERERDLEDDFLNFKKSNALLVDSLRVELAAQSNLHNTALGVCVRVYVGLHTYGFADRCRYRYTYIRIREIEVHICIPVY